MAVFGIHRDPITVDYLRLGEDWCFHCGLRDGCDEKDPGCLFELLTPEQAAEQARVEAIAQAIVERHLARAVADCGPMSRVPAHRPSYRGYSKVST